MRVFIVVRVPAINVESLGIDGAWAEDHPMWCAAYDDLGQTGILSVAATTNRSSLVDEDGDMPSTCASNFLITVTNTDIDDQLYQVAGYGPIHVDLGAPGENSLTTTINNSYNAFGGTSAASPHVAGTIALLYSAPCAAFMNQVKSQPVGAALQLKSLLFESVDPLGTLEGKTVTGGRLNTGVVMHGLCNAFEGPPVDFGINSVYPNPGRGRLTIEISTSHFDMHTLRIFDSAGRLVSETELFPSSQIYRHQFYIPSDMPGVYMALLEHEDDHTSYSFVVQ